MLLPGAAAAATPTIGESFSPASIALNGTSTVTFTIANPDAPVLHTVIFDDTLPAGLRVVPATTTGGLADTTTQVFSTEGAIGNTASAGLTVIGAPTISLLSPVGGRLYTFGQRVRADYGCADDPNGPGISSCVGDVATGALIDTSKAGAHPFTVTATSRDGGIDREIAFYEVAPDNRFKLGRPHALSGGSIEFTVRVPGPGAVVVLESQGSRQFAHGQANARRAGNVRLTVRPNASGRLAVQQGRVKRVSVAVAFTPRGGTRRVERLSLTA